MCGALHAGENHMHKQEGYVKGPYGQVWYGLYHKELIHKAMPLVILHGGALISHRYLTSIVSMVQDRAVVFYDQMGCGDSKLADKTAVAWNMDSFITECEATLKMLMEQYGWKKINLLGHSFGAAIAVEFSLRHPEWVNMLLLDSPFFGAQVWMDDAHIRLKELPEAVQKTILDFESEGKGDVAEYKKAIELYNQSFTCRFVSVSDVLKQSYAQVDRDAITALFGTKRFSIAQDAGITRYDCFGRLGHLQMPTYVSCGKYDECRPETAQRAAEQVKNSSLKIFEHAAHSSYVEDPQEYSAYLNAILAEQ